MEHLVPTDFSREEAMHRTRKTVGTIALTVSVLLGGASVGHAAGYFNGPQVTTSCPSGNACVEGNVRTQGYNYGTTETGYYPISFAYQETNPTRRVRNRNSSTSRPVVIWRANAGGGYTCKKLNYDNRTWVNSSLTNATYMNVETAGYTCGNL